MNGKRATDEQIIRVLKDAEAIGNVREACRKHNITKQTFYRWRNKWLSEDVDVGTIYIDPGSPWQNGYNESFNGICTRLNRTSDSVARPCQDRKRRLW